MPAQAQDRDFSKVEVKAIPVAGSVHMLTGAGGNIGASAGPDGILIVDDQFAPLADRIKQALAGINPGKLKFILNTHYHGDHTGANPAFGKDATIIAQQNVRTRLMTPQTLFGEVRPALPAEAWPVITFDQSVSVHFNGEEVRVVHFPSGHTDGDSVVFFNGSNVVHMGDLFFNGMFPFIDSDHGGDVKGYIADVDAIAKQLPPGAKIIPGHGPLAGAAELAAFQRMLHETSRIVGERIKAGKSVDECKKLGLPDEWKSWSTDFISTEKWVETLHKGLSATVQ
ncbi:MAG: MBL fold metallo-hydrolase [Acidobacteria bacterium]|nr:MBL fold metallo-hydrolase [Acidobacteriota bacterium]